MKAAVKVCYIVGGRTLVCRTEHTARKPVVEVVIGNHRNMTAVGRSLWVQRSRCNSPLQSDFQEVRIGC